MTEVEESNTLPTPAKSKNSFPPAHSFPPSESVKTTPPSTPDQPIPDPERSSPGCDRYDWAFCSPENTHPAPANPAARPLPANEPLQPEATARTAHTTKTPNPSVGRRPSPSPWFHSRLPDDGFVLGMDRLSLDIFDDDDNDDDDDDDDDETLANDNGGKKSSKGGKKRKRGPVFVMRIPPAGGGGLKKREREASPTPVGRLLRKGKGGEEGCR